MRPNTKSYIYLKPYEIFLFLLVFLYLMCVLRHLFFLQSGPEAPKACALLQHNGRSERKNRLSSHCHTEGNTLPANTLFRAHRLSDTAFEIVDFEHICYHSPAYTRGTQNPQTLFVKNRVFIPTCVNFSHLQVLSI